MCEENNSENKEWIHMFDKVECYEFSEFENTEFINICAHGLSCRAFWPRKEIEVSLLAYEDFGLGESSDFDKLFEKKKLAEKLEKLNHRNLLRLLGYAQDGFRLFLIMEKFEISLAQYLKENENLLNQDFAISVAKELVSGLIYLEANYEIQNLNMMNIWMDKNIPKFAYLHLIQTSLDIPNPEINFYDYLKFIDPNFIKDPNFVCDKRSNLFSLGIILASLAGISVYDSDDPEQFILDVYNEKFHWNTNMISVAYVQLCRRCCASDPDLRPSFNEVLFTLENLETHINHVKTNVPELNVYPQGTEKLEESSESMLPSFINLAKVLTEDEYEILESTLKTFDKYTRIFGDDNKVMKKIEEHLTALNQSLRNFTYILKKLRFLPKCACLFGFFNQVGPTIDYNQAIYWYKVATYGKDAFGANQLGYCYSNGMGTKSDKKIAFEWYQVSAKRGHPQGTENTAHLYPIYYGYAEQTQKKVFEMYHSNAQIGYINGQYRTGVCYARGYGVTVNHRIATYWFKKSAEGENEYGEYGVITNLREGFGTNVDVHEAIRWCRRSLRNGSRYAERSLKETFRVE
ncbi:10749_t:CDS:2 [Ambispora gerdemannii]|uniref:10749_t:CDS:1 n=1 Tax=Ambispora gerdemannii TaxID=144530 RepID=A0A9N9C369_9GLOM|nr:10749_t:CDS:2 [Ambispora gerdemannii]